MTTDLNSLPEMAKAKTKRLPMKGVTLDDRMQPRLRVHEEAIARYASQLAGAKADGKKPPFPPILVAQIPGMGAVVVDGYHRYQAHLARREKSITARVIECSFERACWLAALANMSHGLPLTRRDEPEIFRRYMNAGENQSPDGMLKTYRMIESDLAYMRRHTTIRRWMQRMFPETYAEMAKVDPEDSSGEDTKNDHSHSFEVKEIVSYARGISRLTKRTTQQYGERDKEDIAENMRWLVQQVGKVIGMTPDEIVAEQDMEFAV